MQATLPTLGIHGRHRTQPRARPPRRHPADPLHGLDERIEAAVGVDLRLLYGMLVPILLVIGLIVPLLLVHSYWLVAAAWIPEIACLGLIVAKILAMLDEPDETEQRSQAPR